MSKKNYKILAVDDSLSSLKLVCEILLYNGYDVIKTTSGKKGIIYAVEYIPDLIILDIMMPGIDGHSVLKEIKSFDFLKDKPVIMLTASNNKQDVKKSKEAGIYKYILKPISINDFVSTIRSILPMDSYEEVGAYLNGDNFVNEQDENGDLSNVKKECEKIINKKKSSKRVVKVMEKEKVRNTKINVIDGYPVKPVKLPELKAGMVPGVDIKTKGGTVVHPAGLELNEKIISKIQNTDFEIEKEEILIRG